MLGLPAKVLKLSSVLGYLVLPVAVGISGHESFAQAPGQVDDPQAMALGAETAPGQQDVLAALATSAISGTTLTARGHQIAAGGASGNLEGNACGVGTTMISGACHPGYTDGVIIINQFPNTALNTWRCGFKNNTGTTRTVWIYTLCAQ